MIIIAQKELKNQLPKKIEPGNQQVLNVFRLQCVIVVDLFNNDWIPCR